MEATKWEYFDDGGPDELIGVFADSGFTCSVANYYATSYINYRTGKVFTCTGGTTPPAARPPSAATGSSRPWTTVATLTPSPIHRTRWATYVMTTITRLHRLEFDASAHVFGPKPVCEPHQRPSV